MTYTISCWSCNLVWGVAYLTTSPVDYNYGLKHNFSLSIPVFVFLSALFPVRLFWQSFLFWLYGYTVSLSLLEKIIVHTNVNHLLWFSSVVTVQNSHEYNKMDRTVAHRSLILMMELKILTIQIGFIFAIIYMKYVSITFVLLFNFFIDLYWN